MSINPLPEDTVRLLGSAAVITTPVGLVKELLENAIDAGAASIDILVSQNMVDRIEVRDNGSGIHPDDYECLGRAGHTSKLTSYEELHTIGATTLGFRGQALASANSMGNVTIITRTLQEQTAVRLELRHGFGGIESQEHTSAPVGSTVSVTALFSRLPVRQQVVLKEAQKNIINIKHLLHAYALARPHIRLSFKVLGGNPKQPWSYSPRPQATVKEAVVQVFGTGVMSQCLSQILATDIGTEDDVCHVGPDLVIEAILPKPDADLSKLSKGPFISIDSRPMTALRGTGRNLMNIFRTQFKKLRGVDDVPRALNDTFLRVNIRCSPGTYDPNIEPSKDQIIFANESRVTDLFERLCTGVYKAQGTRSVFATIEKRTLISEAQPRTPPPSSDGPHDDEQSTFGLEDTAGGSTSQSLQSPTSCYSSPLHPHPLKMDTESSQQPQQSKRPRDSPFPRHGHQSPLAAEMSGGSISQERSRLRQAHLIHPLSENTLGREINPPKSIQDTHNEQTDPIMNVMSPHRGREVIQCQPVSASNQSRKRQFVVDMSVDPDVSSDEEAEMLASRFRELQDKNSHSGEHNVHSREGLNPWVVAKMTAPTRQPLSEDVISAHITPCLGHGPESEIVPGVGEASEEELPILRPQGLGGPPGDLDPPPNTRTGISQIEHHGAQGFQQLRPMANLGIPHAFASRSDYDIPGPPILPAKSSDRHTLPNLEGYCNDAENAGSDGFVQSTLSFVGPSATQKEPKSHPQMHINDVPAKPNPPFRKPRRLNTGSRHLSAGQGIRTSVSPGSICTGSRYHNEHPRSPMTDNPLVQVSSTSSRTPFRSQGSHLAQHIYSPNSNTGNVGDRNLGEGPREYLVKRQLSELEHRGQAHQTIKRTMTDRLPLETIPRGHETQHLVLIVKPDTKKLGRNQKRVTEAAIVNEGSLCAEIDLEDVAEIEARLKHAVSAWADNTLGGKIEVEINLRRVVKGKGVDTENG